MFSMPNTLSFRLTRSYAVTFSLFFLCGLVLCYFLLAAVLHNRMEDSLVTDIQELGSLFGSGGIARVTEELDLELAENGDSQIFFRMLDGAGGVLYESNTGKWEGIDIEPSALVRFKRGELQSILLDDLQSDGEPARGIFGQVGPNHYLQIGESTEEITEVLEIVLLIFLLVFMCVLPLATWIGWRISQKAVHGIRAVTQAADQLRDGNLDHHIAFTAQDDEIQDLVSTFNGMAERIRKLIAEMREMIDNIAHDLRSPLARIKVIAESNSVPETSLEESQNATREILAECDRLLTLINTTLDVAEAEAQINHKDLESLDLAVLIAEVCDLYQPLAEQKKISFLNNISGDYNLVGQKQNLRRMLANLIDNALKYTPANGSVKVSVTPAEGSDNGVVVNIADSGIGIPEADQPFVFNRFYRCDNSRSEEGCGLGLSYAAAVAKAHGGKISFNSTFGKGTTFSLVFN